MSLQQLEHSTPARRGRKLKGGLRRRVVQARMPAPIQEAFAELADESAMPMSDLGSYYLIQGWNQARQSQGLSVIEMPQYLEEAMQRRKDSGRGEETLLDVVDGPPTAG
jgi:hypothetical protein